MMFDLLSVGLLIALAPIIMGLVSLTRTSALRRDTDIIRQYMIGLAERVGRLESGERPEVAPPAAAAEEVTEETVEPAEEEPEPEPEVPAEEAGREEEAAFSPGAAPQPAAQPAAPRMSAEAIERSFTSKLLVWVGGAVLALGGAFLVRFAIDYGLLSPGVRVSLGILLGAGLIVLSEWLRRRPFEQNVLNVDPYYLPAAASGAGLFTLYASAWAAHYLYDFIGPTGALVIFSLVTVLAFLLALKQGPFLAVLALLGGYLTPVLVRTDDPSIYGLFTYLLLLYAAVAAITYFRRWNWMSYLSLTGVGIWAVLGIIGANHPEAAFIGLYAVLVLVLTLTPSVLDGYFRELTVSSDVGLLLRRAPVEWVAGILAAAVVWLIGIATDHSPPALFLAGSVLLVCMSYARYREEQAWFQLIGVLLLLASLTFFRPDEMSRGLFLYTMAGYMALAGVTGFAGLWGAERPGLWSGVAVGTTLLLLIIGYGHLQQWGLDMEWALAAAGLAAIYLGAALAVNMYLDARGMTDALGAWAVGVPAALGLAFAFWLEEAWLTVAIAAEVAAVGWIYSYLKLKPLRWTGIVLALIVMARLLFNYNLLDYTIESVILSWILYAYGVPIAAFLVAARFFRDKTRDGLVTLLEAGALAFTMAFFSLEVRSLMAGSLSDLDFSFAEQITHSIVWLAAGLGLYYRSAATENNVVRIGWQAIFGAGSVFYFLVVVLANNPLTGGSTGELTIFNLVGLGYAVPAALYGALAWVSRRRGEGRLSLIASGIAVALTLIWFSLEIRHVFHGSRLDLGLTTDAEIYAYSVAWIVYAGILLFLGILRSVPGARYASLAVIVITLVKLGLVDFAALEGIYRPLSFIGLGLAIIAIAYLYRRYVFPPQPPPVDAE